MDSLSFSNDVVEFPLLCEVCEDVALFEGEEQEIFTVAESGSELEDEEWYMHLFTEGLDIEDKVVVEGRLVAFCPECAPETAIGGRELEEYIKKVSD